MPASAPLNVRVVVKLPYNRPENPLTNPPKIVWNQEKADILWKVIERSRSVDSAGADWKGLAEHLQVPLPYLLFRVNARFQEDIRGLRDIKGALSPTSTQEPSPGSAFPTFYKPTPPAMSRHGGGSRNTPVAMGVRQRLNSLGNHALAATRRKPIAASNATFQAPQTRTHAQPVRGAYRRGASSPPLPLSDDDGESDSDDADAANKEEEAERQAEEADALARKLVELQMMMTNETLGLVSGGRAARVDKGRPGTDRDRGRSTPLSQRSLGSSRVDTLSSRSESLSSVGSPQGSIPDIPSQSSGSQPHSPGGRGDMSFGMPSSPPGMSGRNQAKRRLVGLQHQGDLSSNQGSSASSFSDFSDASISASVMESAFGSNFGNARLSQFSRARPPSNRTHSVVPQ